MFSFECPLCISSSKLQMIDGDDFLDLMHMLYIMCTTVPCISFHVLSEIILFSCLPVAILVLTTISSHEFPSSLETLPSSFH